MESEGASSFKPVESGNRGGEASTSRASGFTNASNQSWFVKPLDPSNHFKNMSTADVDKLIVPSTVTPCIKLNPNGSNLGPWATGVKSSMVTKGCWAAVCWEFPDSNANAVALHLLMASLPEKWQVLISRMETAKSAFDYRQVCQVCRWQKQVHHP